ncbi:MAG TPA: rhodanese-like domain-containing protein [Gammaproteobacteria bacterium]|nr:rhodanese-like domain-containing protein [Gammaproteobacteria bacterium]
MKFQPSFSQILLCFILIAGMQSSIFAEKKLAPENIPGTTRVSAEEVLDLFGKIDDLLIIDARIRMDRKHGYIEGSISLPDVETNCATLKKLIKKKDSPVLFYCNGIKCGRSVKSSRVALKCGYNNIYWFRGGFEEWKSKNLPFVKS